MADVNVAGHCSNIILFYLCLLLSVGSVFKAVLSDEVTHRRFEYKLSFKGPQLTNKAGKVPFWTDYGTAIPSNEEVRITPSLHDQRGGLWCRTQSANEFWEIEVFFKVTGTGRLGGDGLAVWFTESIGQPGPVFGSSDYWKGMGLFFDSYDNDGKKNNPYVMVMLNDGKKQYDHLNDGLNQQLGGCMRDFRNKPHVVRTRIRYYKNILTVFYNGGMSDKNEDYELCIQAENVHLPKEGFYGVTAGTGGLVDNHDVHKFLAYSLGAPKSESERQRKKLNEAERKGYEEQYGKYLEELEEQKESYRKENPETKSHQQSYEANYEKYVRLVYEGQNAINKIINKLQGEVIGLTQRVDNVRTDVKTVRPTAEVATGKEVNAIISQQNQVHKTLRQVQEEKNSIDDKMKLDQLEQSLQTILENVGHILTATKELTMEPPPCPTVSCITNGNLFSLIFIIVFLAGGYLSYQKHKDQFSKKFY